MTVCQRRGDTETQLTAGRASLAMISPSHAHVTPPYLHKQGIGSGDDG